MGKTVERSWNLQDMQEAAPIILTDARAEAARVGRREPQIRHRPEHGRLREGLLFLHEPALKQRQKPFVACRHDQMRPDRDRKIWRTEHIHIFFVLQKRMELKGRVARQPVADVAAVLVRQEEKRQILHVQADGFEVTCLEPNTA